jgi:hypothetical protein
VILAAIMGLRWAGVFLFLFPKKSITLALERVVAEALGDFGGFPQRMGHVASWSNFESWPKWPFCNFGPFDSCATNPEDVFLPLLYIAGMV